MIICPSRSPKAMTFIVLSIVGTILLVIFFTKGGIQLTKENYKFDNFKETTCLVKGTGIRMYRCSQRRAKYPCYGAIWNVTFVFNMNSSAEVSDTKRFDEIFKAQQSTQKYRIGLNYTCWYDTKMQTYAQWNKPNKTTPIVLLSVGGFITALTILFVVLAVIFTRQEFQRMHYMNMSTEAK